MTCINAMKNKKKFNQVAIFFERCWLFAFQHSSAFLWCCFFYYAYNINFIVIAERNETRANILFHSNSLSVNLLEKICTENPNCNRSIAQCNSKNTKVDLFFNTVVIQKHGGNCRILWFIWPPLHHLIFRLALTLE